MSLRKEHWEKVYTTKEPNEVSWTQVVPKTSLALIHHSGIPKSASIIDVGGGDSMLVDHLLDEGFENVTVLDISSAALERAKQRLGAKALRVKWIASDVTEFMPTESYDLWHDRAMFHFLTSAEDVAAYLAITSQFVTGFMTIGTFSDKGPDKCSGLTIHKYSEEALQEQFTKYFQRIECVTEEHITPFNTTQHFLFCLFARR